MPPERPDWTVAADEVRAITAYLREHFPDAEVRALTEASDPGQLFLVLDREGTRYSLKILREALDDLRGRKAPIAPFLAKQEIAHRLRHGGRVTVLRARGEDMIREGSP